jgi:hypothetical protein
MKVIGSAATHTSLAQGGAPLTFAPASYEALFFGKRPARRVDPRKYRHLTKGKRKLEYLASEALELVGSPELGVTVALAEGSNASISRDGELRVGVQLLEAKQDDDDFLVALVGHEVGHQPWRWPLGPLEMNQRQLNELYKAEERRADETMGRILAQLGASPDSMARFLLSAARFEKTPPLDYDPAEQRVALLRASFQKQSNKQKRTGVAGLERRSTARPLR